MILLPTRNRAKNLARFIEAYHKTEASERVLLICDMDDHTRLPELPGHWPTPHVNHYSRDLKEALNSAVRAYGMEPYYGMMADDVVPESPRWDWTLKTACGAHKIAWGDDGVHQGRLCTHPFIGGDLVRAWGWFIPPYVKRGYADFIWKDFADALDLGMYIDSAKLTHLHWQVGKADFDTTYAMQPSVKSDIKAWEEYRVSPVFEEDLKRVKETLKL